MDEKEIVSALRDRARKLVSLSTPEDSDLGDLAIDIGAKEGGDWRRLYYGKADPALLGAIAAGGGAAAVAAALREKKDEQ